MSSDNEDDEVDADLSVIIMQNSSVNHYILTSNFMGIKGLFLSFVR